MLGQHMPKSGGIILPFLGLNMNMAEHVFFFKYVKPLASLAVTPQQWNMETLQNFFCQNERPRNAAETD